MKENYTFLSDKNKYTQAWDIYATKVRAISICLRQCVRVQGKGKLAVG